MLSTQNVSGIIVSTLDAGSKGLGSSPKGGGGVLRYISDGDVRSPFLGLKFAI